MDVKFERLSEVNGLITVSLAEADYADKVKKQLKDIAKNHVEKGFRPGAAPKSLIEKKYGTAVKYDVVNKTVSDALFDYVKEQVEEELQVEEIVDIMTLCGSRIDELLSLDQKLAARTTQAWE